MKKIKIILLTLCFMLVLSYSTLIYYASSLDSFNPKYGITSSNVNFRSMATTSSFVIKELNKGTKLKLVGMLNDFYIVQLSGNEVGLVYKDYVKNYTSAPTNTSTYTNIGKTQGTINTSGVNFRRGPSTSFSSIKKLDKGTTVTVIGKIGNWYLAITSNNTVGMIHNDYITLKTGSTPSDTNSTSELSNVELVLKLINDARQKAGVAPLKLGATLPKLAELKAEDMVKNSYFAHTSKTYGTPFKMMEDYNIDYNTAGENIAGNPNIKAAVESWLASSTHKQNLLSSSYQYIGIGIAKSPTYGYIIVAMFVG